MSQDTTILDKIKKLLRLGASPNAHEAALAMDAAFRLASKHSISINDIDLSEDERRLVAEYLPLGSRLSFDRHMVLSVVNTFFNVCCVLSRGRVCFIGTQSDIAIATYVYEFLVTTVRRQAKKFASQFPRKISATRRKSFVAGFIYGITSKLKGSQSLLLDDSKTSIVLAVEAQRQRKKEELFPRCGPKALPCIKREQPDAVNTGYIAGKETSITPAVNPASSPLLLTQ